ncbi:hypothetical protein OKW76_00420 [Sphingomonas sp. S1-29]|uniref:hypothetical protein n=1 Tax=Sphingomonas sp. S1-29 TaxID=2991074 RepID=UPI00223ECEBC|nr:hypothetical protein [Sphingomonas sp. S1-29]UZK69589.1 hypothetical protein OKW76_00420 [Sphingomonas sp. S1-29]
MTNSYADMAIRLENAFLRLTDSLMVAGDISPVDAAKVARVYIHCGLARLDAVDGQHYIRHGQFMERDMIQRAAGEAGDKLLASKPTPWRYRR